MAVMPTPRVLQASCGLSVRFAPEESQRVDRLLSGELKEEEFALYTAVRTEEGQNVFLAFEDNIQF